MMRMITEFRRWLEVAGAKRLAASMIVYGLGMGVLAPMNAIYLHESVGLSKNEVAAVFAVSLLANMVLTMAVGTYSDRLHRRKPLPIAAAVLCLIGLLWYMTADSFVEAMLSMTLVTAPSGLIFGQLFAMARQRFTSLAPDIVEISQIWLRAGFSVGFFLGLLAGANLYLIATFQGVLWGNFLGYAVLCLLLVTYQEHTGPVKAAQAAGVGEPFSAVMLIALLLLSCSDSIRGLYLPLVVNELFGRPEWMAYLWSAQAVFELLFMTLSGYWAQRWGARPVMLLGGACALVTYLFYSTGSSLGLFFAVQPMYSLFVSILYGAAMGYVQRMFINRTGFGSSLYIAITQTATLIGYILPTFVSGVKQQIFFIPAGLTAAGVALICWSMFAPDKIGAAGNNTA